MKGSKVARKRIKSFVALAAAATMALAACGDGDGGGSSGDNEVAKIGVFLPLTGENADNGEHIKNAVEMFADEYNEADHKHKIELVVRDDRGEPKTATNIAREFAEDDKIVAVVGSFTSTAAMAAAPIFEKAGIPQISPTSSHPDFTGLGKYIYRGTPTQDKEAALIAQYLKDDLGKDKAAIIYRQDDWGNSASEQFAEGFKAAGGEITKIEAVAPDSRDFRTLVTSMKSANIDSVYLALQYSDAAVLAQQMASSGWEPTVITATSLYTHELMNLSGPEAVEGWHVPAFFFAESEEPAVANFVNAYKERYGELPNAHAGTGYDSMGMIGTALDTIDATGKDGREALGEALFDATFDGATGKLNFDENGDVEKQVTWLEIHDGEFVHTD